MKLVYIIWPLFLVVFSVFKTSPVGTVYAQNSTVGATVKVNVCGNGIVEPPVEDCEGLDLNSGTCQSQGFLEGELACDISCEYDTSGCFGTPVPTSTPAPTSTTTPTPTPIQDAGDSSSSGGDASAVTSPTPAGVQLINQSDLLIDLIDDLVNEITYLLPENMAHLDIDGDGKINRSEVTEAVELWISSWRSDKESGCDLNNDSMCNIIDFSVLMYHVDK